MINKVTGHLYRCLNTYIHAKFLIKCNCGNIYLCKLWEFKTNSEELEVDSDEVGLGQETVRREPKSCVSR